MLKHQLLIILLILPLGLMAQEQSCSDSPSTKSSRSEKKSGKVLTGFSGGMLFHIGYAFSQSPDELFRNASLSGLTDQSGLPSDGVTLGLGGALRLHLKDHIHLGLEGGMTTMPLMKSGSNLRNGWGGVLCDYYFTLGKIKPMIGAIIGGGSSKRLYVPADAEVLQNDTTLLSLNASYTKTPFFLLDPYIGLEVKVSNHAGLVIKVDWMLPFGKSSGTLSTDDIKWRNYISPSGPRIYVGILFGH